MASSGGPLKGCEDMYQVQVCVAVLGEIFTVLPYSATLANVENFLSTVLNDPISFVFFTTTLLCTSFPRGKSILNLESATCKLTNSITNIISWINSLASSYQRVASLIENGEEAISQQDICEDFHEQYEDLD